jgi:hypothetical protein
MSVQALQPTAIFAPYLQKLPCGSVFPLFNNPKRHGQRHLTALELLGPTNRAFFHFVSRPSHVTVRRGFVELDRLSSPSPNRTARVSEAVHWVFMCISQEGYKERAGLRQIERFRTTLVTRMASCRMNYGSIGLRILSLPIHTIFLSSSYRGLQEVLQATQFVRKLFAHSYESLSSITSCCKTTPHKED